MVVHVRNPNAGEKESSQFLGLLVSYPGLMGEPQIPVRGSTLEKKMLVEQ